MREVRLSLFLCLASMALGQDPFEIHIYEYEPMTRGQYSPEAHLNLDTQGTGSRDGTLLPSARKTHLTMESTFGISENFAIGFMFLAVPEEGGMKLRKRLIVAVLPAPLAPRRQKISAAWIVRFSWSSATVPL